MSGTAGHSEFAGTKNRNAAQAYEWARTTLWPAVVRYSCVFSEVNSHNPPRRPFGIKSRVSVQDVDEEDGTDDVDEGPAVCGID